MLRKHVTNIYNFVPLPITVTTLPYESLISADYNSVTKSEMLLTCLMQPWNMR